MLFVSTHLGLSEDIRLRQIRLITQFVHRMTRHQRDEHYKELIVFVVGDFNERNGPSGPLWDRLFAANSSSSSSSNETETKSESEEVDSVDVSDVLTDCVLEWQSLFNRTLNANITYHAFEGLQHLADDTNHAPIDWILCSKNVIENADILLVDSFIVTNTRYSATVDNHTVYPSDHFPIVLEIVILEHPLNESLLSL